MNTGLTARSTADSVNLNEMDSKLGWCQGGALEPLISRCESINYLI